jgi:hypothetical protein
VVTENRRATLTFAMNPLLVPGDGLTVSLPRPYGGEMIERHEVLSLDHDFATNLTTADTAIVYETSVG